MKKKDCTNKRFKSWTKWSQGRYEKRNCNIYDTTQKEYMYCKILNSGCTNKCCNVDLTEFYNFYRGYCNKELIDDRHLVLFEERENTIKRRIKREC